jgi:cytochrome c oxidase subunit II
MKTQNILKISALITGAIALTVTSIWIGKQAYSWLPPPAAAESLLIDDLISFLVTLGTFIFLGVTGTLMYSVIFHRATKDDYSDGPAIEGNLTLEIVWTVIPVMLVFWIAGYSYQIYEQMGIQGPTEHVHFHMPTVMQSAYAAPKDLPNNAASEPTEKIDVLAKQWAWVFHYPEKNVTSTELHLPVDSRVSLALQSEDVLHGFYIPAFRLKQDIVPNLLPSALVNTV